MSTTFPALPFPGEEGKIAADMNDRPPAARRVSPWADVLFSALAHGAAWLTLALLAGILVSLVIGAAPAIRAYGLTFLWTSEWDPVQNRYGGLVMIYGTLITSLIALLIAVPSGRLSQSGESSVRKSAMPKLTGTATTRAMNEVISVP